MTKRLKIEQKINDLLTLKFALDKGDHLEVCRGTQLVSVVDYDEFTKDLVQLAINQVIKQLNAEIMTLREVEE